MNRKDYDPAVLSTFDVIGCYFVDIFYNHLYLSANSIRKETSFAASSGAAGANSSANNMRERSLTDEYKSAVHAYMLGVTRDEKYYKKTITGLQTFYQTYTKYNTIGLNAFIDRVINTFLPEEYANSLNNGEKEFFLNDIISSVVKEFCSRAVDITHLKQIIDSHDNEYNTRAWVDELIDLQITEREKIFEKFTRKLAGGRAEQYEKIDVSVAQKIAAERDKIWEELTARVKEMSILESRLADSKKVAAKMYEAINALKTRIAELEKENKSLRDRQLNTPSPVTSNTPRGNRRGFKIVDVTADIVADASYAMDGPSGLSKSPQSQKTSPPRGDNESESESGSDDEEGSTKSNGSDDEDDDAGVEKAMKNISRSMLH